MALQNIDPNIVTSLAASGSEIATTRSTIPFEATVKDDSTGFIYSPQTQQSYDPNTLTKAIDTKLSEIVAPGEEQNLDLVPRPLYEDALEALAIAEETIQTQSQTISELESKISELQSKIETLSSDLDNEKLLRVVAEANADNLRQQLQLINESAQVALQRSILEGIQRSSAEAKTEGLKAEVAALKEKATQLQSQIDGLNNLLNGKNAQIAAGAESTPEITVRVISKPAMADNDISFDASITDANAGGGGFWVNGPDVEVMNVDPTGNAQTINVDVTQCIADGQVWVFRPTGLPVTLQVQEKATFKLVPDYNAIKNVYPRTRTFTTATSYAGGKITVSANTTSLSLSARLYKHKDG
jgi:hypothetical protein